MAKLPVSTLFDVSSPMSFNRLFNLLLSPHVALPLPNTFFSPNVLLHMQSPTSRPGLVSFCGKRGRAKTTLKSRRNSSNLICPTSFYTWACQIAVLLRGRRFTAANIQVCGFFDRTICGRFNTSSGRLKSDLTRALNGVYTSPLYRKRL